MEAEIWHPEPIQQISAEKGPTTHSRYPAGDWATDFIRPPAEVAGAHPPRGAKLQNTVAQCGLAASMVRALLAHPGRCCDLVGRPSLRSESKVLPWERLVGKLPRDIYTMSIKTDVGHGQPGVRSFGNSPEHGANDIPRLRPRCWPKTPSLLLSSRCASRHTVYVNVTIRPGAPQDERSGRATRRLRLHDLPTGRPAPARSASCCGPAARAPPRGPRTGGGARRGIPVRAAGRARSSATAVATTSANAPFKHMAGRAWGNNAGPAPLHKTSHENTL